MSDNHPVYGGDVNLDALGDVLIEMGNRLKDNNEKGMNLSNVEYNEDWSLEEFRACELTLTYHPAEGDMLEKPITKS